MRLEVMEEKPYLRVLEMDEISEEEIDEFMEDEDG
jgi:hypothetical protein